MAENQNSFDAYNKVENFRKKLGSFHIQLENLIPIKKISQFTNLTSTTDALDDEPKTNLIDECKEKYKEICELGQVFCFKKGSHGLVLLVSERKTEKDFACKFLRADDEELNIRIRDEFNMLQNLNHINIVKVFEFFQYEKYGKSFLIMEYLPYPNLKNLIKTLKREKRLNGKTE